MNAKLRSVGWTGRYIRDNKVYGTKKMKTVSMESIGRLLHQIYGNKVCVDEDFIRLYLKAQGLDDTYILTHREGLDNEVLFELTEWIPTLEELSEYRIEEQTKKRK